MTQSGQPALEARLAAISGAVDAGEVEEAAERMAGYDSALRNYIETTAPHTPVEVLRELLRMQNTLLLQMRDRQAGIGELLRRTQRQATAANAYTSTEDVL